MKLDALVFCNQAFRDEFQRFNVIGIFDTVWAPKVPAKHGPVHIYLRVSGIESKREFKFSVQIFNRSDGEKKELEARGTFRSTGTIAELNIPMNAITLTSFGVYRAILLIDDQNLGYADIEVKKGGKPETN